MNKELWSDKSKASVDYVLARDYYEDIRFNCRACGASSVFTAAEQKYTYEVKKAYVWEQHVLCPSCFRTCLELQAEAATLLAAWLEDKALLTRSAPKLRRWLEVLELLPRFGVRKDTARIRMLARVLAQAD